MSSGSFTSSFPFNMLLYIDAEEDALIASTYAFSLSSNSFCLIANSDSMCSISDNSFFISLSNSFCLKLYVSVANFLVSAVASIVRETTSAFFNVPPTLGCDLSGEDLVIILNNSSISVFFLCNSCFLISN